MAATHYRSASRGLVAIADMPTPHLANAIAKLRREEPGRIAEIEAMSAEHDKRPDKEPT